MNTFSFLQTEGANGQIDWLPLVLQMAVVGVSAPLVYKLTDWLAYLFWAARILCSRGRIDRTVPGYVKACVALALSLVLPSLFYVVVLVDGGLIKYDYRGFVAVVCATFMTSWSVYQRSKYADRSGEEVMKDGAVRLVKKD